MKNHKKIAESVEKYIYLEYIILLKNQKSKKQLRINIIQLGQKNDLVEKRKLLYSK